MPSGRPTWPVVRARACVCGLVRCGGRHRGDGEVESVRCAVFAAAAARIAAGVVVTVIVFIGVIVVVVVVGAVLDVTVDTPQHRTTRAHTEEQLHNHNLAC